MTIDVHKIYFGKEILSNMTPEDRALFILSGHLLNEINFYGKLLYWAQPSNFPDELQVKACLTQYISIVKVFSGKLHESWEAIRELYFGKICSKKYSKVIEPDSADSLKNLKKYFSKNNVVSTIRNKFAFHYDDKFISEAYDCCPNEEDWSMYLSKMDANSLYYFSEAAINHKMLNEINSENLQSAMNLIHTDFIHVWKHMVRFLSGLMVAVGDEYGIGGYENADVSSFRVEVTNGEKGCLPFFSEVSKI